MRRAIQTASGKPQTTAAHHGLFLTLIAPLFAAVLLLLLYGAWPLDLPLVLSALIPAYAIGAVPAFFAARIDRAVARNGYGAGTRLSVAAGIACVIGLLILSPLYLTDRVHGTMPLLLPLALAFSAALALGLAMATASLLASLRRKPPDPASEA